MIDCGLVMIIRQVCYHCTHRLLSLVSLILLEDEEVSVHMVSVFFCDGGCVFCPGS